jgi:hypothetical protein
MKDAVINKILKDLKYLKMIIAHFEIVLIEYKNNPKDDYKLYYILQKFASLLYGFNDLSLNNIFQFYNKEYDEYKFINWTNSIYKSLINYLNRSIKSNIY